MPRKQKTYERVIFTPEVIKEALEVLLTTLPDADKNLPHQILEITLPSKEYWAHDSEDEFFADYRRGFNKAQYRKFSTGGPIDFIVSSFKENTPLSRITVRLSNRSDVEKVFNVFEANVDKCRLPEQPKEETGAVTNWVAETLVNIETHCPIAAHKLKLALFKLDLESAEEWQNSAMLIRDAWIELSKWLCQVNSIDTSDISPDAVVDRLRKLKLDKSDEKLFNLARASFNLYSKHHSRDIEHDISVACVISTIVSIKAVIQEVLNAAG